MSDIQQDTPLALRDMARMRALRNGVYHKIRREFYERWERRLNFVVVFLGTATATEFILSITHIEKVTVYLGLATAIVGTLQLVWGVGSRARDHAVFQSKFYSLASRLERLRGPEADNEIHDIEADFAQIYGEEPPTYNAVNALAYNAAQGGFARDPRHNLIVPWYYRMLKNVGLFSPDDFETYYERDNRLKRELAEKKATTTNQAT